MDPAPLRRAIRAHLVGRPTVAQSADTIRRHLGREHDATIEGIADALEFLTGLRHLKLIRDALGGPTKYYQATAEGILAHETE